MIRVTINRDGLERGTADFPIRIEEVAGPGRWEARDIRLLGTPRVVYSPDSPLPDGARVWIEASDFTAAPGNFRPLP